ncbi:hypothetical protein [Phaeobacter inhibens]|uniref:hypothetical protein n=1 Tax=Phaeobacter inhibens TaxID=221822 RepID=UPI000CA0F8C1|nr:hypothetical protein [Phaeobacter inhibens]AUQ64399.1 hypothetical protein PhaeoP51_03468 [Phaeobacter inhibens]
MNAQAQIGHNQAPDPLDEALAPYGDFITEAEGWLDGQTVTTEDQMKAVDAIAKQVKAAKKDVTNAQKSESAPLHDAWKAALARYKPTIDDLDRMAKGLAALVDGFKRKLAEEKRAKERAAWEAAEKARREAEAKAAAADTANIDEQREAEEARRAAQEAEKAAQAARKDTASVKGLRTVTRYEIINHKAALHDIAANDRDAMTAFIEDYVRRNHKARAINGVKVWQDQEAF